MAQLPDEILAFLTKLRLSLLAIAVGLVLLTSLQGLALALATLALSLRVFAQIEWFQKLMLRLFKLDHEKRLNDAAERVIGKEGVDRITQPKVMKRSDLMKRPDVRRAKGLPPLPSEDDVPELPWGEGEDLPEAEFEAMLQKEQQPAIYLKRHWPVDPVSEANSYLGGLPKLPDDLAWPVNEGSGFALHHIAQIDLAEMPQADGDTQLPAQGMLWFFADIDDQLLWDDGPGDTQNCVLFWPATRADLPEQTAPENLPEIDHHKGEMKKTLYSFRGPPRHVYHRWPLTGHLSTSLPLDDEMPRGYAWNGDYLALRRDRMREIERAMHDDFPERVALPKQVLSTEHQGRKGKDDQWRHWKEISYDPEALGGRFPYVAAMACDVVDVFAHRVAVQFEDQERGIASARRDDKEPDPVHLADMDVLRLTLTDLAELKSDLMQLAPDAVLGPEELGQFDLLIKHAAFELRNASSAQDILQGAWHLFFQRTVVEPALTALVPAEIIATAQARCAPGMAATSHYLLGAKGSKSNATSGRGVRLAQFDSDHAVDFMFCDCGIIDFWIDAEDLAMGRWDRAWAATAGG